MMKITKLSLEESNLSSCNSCLKLGQNVKIFKIMLKCVGFRLCSKCFNIFKKKINKIKLKDI